MNPPDPAPELIAAIRNIARDWSGLRAVIEELARAKSIPTPARFALTIWADTVDRSIRRATDLIDPPARPDDVG